MVSLASPRLLQPIAFGLLQVVVWALIGGDNSAIAQSGRQAELFEMNIRPLLEAACVRCHGPEKQQSGLRTDQREKLLRGRIGGTSSRSRAQ